MSKTLLFSLILLMAFLAGCERDDICADSTPTTPKAIITFYDDANQESLKSVTGLRIWGEGMDDDPLSDINVVTTDSIAIPLRTDMTESRFVFHRDYETDGMGTVTGGNPDVVIITYATEEVYVSRACGFKTIFKNFTFEVVNDGDVWILSHPNEEGITNIDNENQAHINIRH